MFVSPTRHRAAIVNNRQAGLGLLFFMLMAVLLLVGLPSEPGAHPPVNMIEQAAD